jgi:hypothetical protein
MITQLTDLWLTIDLEALAVTSMLKFSLIITFLVIWLMVRVTRERLLLIMDNLGRTRWRLFNRKVTTNSMPNLVRTKKCMNK